MFHFLILAPALVCNLIAGNYLVAEIMAAVWFSLSMLDAALKYQRRIDAELEEFVTRYHEKVKGGQ